PGAAAGASTPGPGFALVAGTRRRPGRSAHSIQARPRAAAAAPESTGTVVGAGAPDRAQSGSFRPLPVIVQTTREPVGTRPSADAASRPATLADEPSSPNTASSRARIR